MGHELAHYMARHSVKQLTTTRVANIGMGLLTMALPEDSGTASLVTGLGTMGFNLARLRYGRSQEEQADRVGTYYLYRAGYEPRRALDMQKLLHSLGGPSKSSFLDEYLSTHPTEETRLRRIEEVIQELSLDDGRYKRGDGTFSERWQQRLAPLQAAQKAYDVFDRGEQALREGKAAEALALCRKAQSMAPNQAPMHRLEGDVLRKMNRLKEARAAYSRAVAVDRRYLQGVYGLGAVDMGERNFSAAANQFRACLRLLPDSLDGHYGLGVSTFHLGQYGEAVTHLEVVAGNVQHPGVFSYLGQAYEKAGEKGKAVEAYRACLQAVKEGTTDSSLVTIARDRLKVLQGSS